MYSTPTGTPPPRHDSYSPAPRRGYPPPGPGPLPLRPGLNPRSSSLTLASAGSSTLSLPGTARAPNGGPRRQPTGGARSHFADPLQVLESILGGPPKRAPAMDGDDRAAQERPAELDGDIDFGSLSLHEFAVQETPEQQQPTPVHIYSAQSVEECMCSFTALGSFAHRLQMIKKRTDLKIYTCRFWHAMRY